MAQTKVKLVSDGVITVDNLNANHGITTDNIGEGSALYYTDARVSSYLTTNSYATEDFVTTAVSNVSGGGGGASDLASVTDVGNITTNSIEVGDITATNAFIKSSVQQLGSVLEVNDTTVSNTFNVPTPYAGNTFTSDGSQSLQITYYASQGPLPDPNDFVDIEFTFSDSGGELFKATFTSYALGQTSVVLLAWVFDSRNTELYNWLNSSGNFGVDFGWSYPDFTPISNSVITSIYTQVETISSEIKVDAQLSDIDTSKSYFVSNQSDDFNFGGPIPYPVYPNDYLSTLYGNMWSTLTSYGSQNDINSVGDTFYWVFNNPTMPTPTAEFSTDSLIYFKLGQNGELFEITAKVTSVNYMGSYKEIYFEVVEFIGNGGFSMMVFYYTITESIIASSPIQADLNLQTASFSESNGNLVLEFDNTDPVGRLSAGETIYVVQSENKIDFVSPYGESINLATYDFVSDSLSVNSTPPFVYEQAGNVITRSTTLEGTNTAATVLGVNNTLNGDDSQVAEGNVLIGANLSSTGSSLETVTIGGNNSGTRTNFGSTIIGYRHTFESKTSYNDKLQYQVILGYLNTSNTPIYYSNNYATDRPIGSIAIGNSSRVAGRGAIALGTYAYATDSGAVAINSNGHWRYELGGNKSGAVSVADTTFAALYKSISSYTAFFKTHSESNTYATYTENNGSIYFGLSRLKSSNTFYDNESFVVKVDGVLRRDNTNIEFIEGTYILKYSSGTSSFTINTISSGNSNFPLWINLASKSAPDLDAFYISIQNMSGATSTFHSFTGTVDVYYLK